jgi:serine/threonine protein phosphatase PrpC
MDAGFLKVAKSKNYSDGTTCLMALINNGVLTVANVGDSSALLVRNGQMVELTSE